MSATADEFHQLVDLDEAVVEDHVLADAQVPRQPLQAEPVALALLAHQVGVRRAQDDVDEIGKLLEITSGIARSMYSIPLFGESSPKVSATSFPSTPNWSL